MIAFFLAVLLTQSTAPSSASPTPQLDSAWKKAALGKDEYAHYVRTEPDGTQSELVANRQVCDCQPANLVKMLTSAFATVKGAATTNDSLVICGASQSRLVATGLAGSTSGAHNIEVIAFRKEPAFIMLELLFNSPRPPADAEYALAAVCP